MELEEAWPEPVGMVERLEAEDEELLGLASMRMFSGAIGAIWFEFSAWRFVGRFVER